MADAQLKNPRDRHPEISAPILQLSLEAQIARAEQRVVDRDARMRDDARRIVETVRSKRGEAIRWAAIGAGAAAIGAIGYAGWRAWRARASASGEARRDSARASGAEPGFLEGLAAFARAAVQWALRLHREHGVTGSLFGMARSAFWPRAAASTDAAPTSAGASQRRGIRDSI